MYSIRCWNFKLHYEISPLSYKISIRLSVNALSVYKLQIRDYIIRDFIIHSVENTLAAFLSSISRRDTMMSFMLHLCQVQSRFTFNNYR